MRKGSSVREGHDTFIGTETEWTLWNHDDLLHVRFKLVFRERKPNPFPFCQDSAFTKTCAYLCFPAKRLRAEQLFWSDSCVAHQLHALSALQPQQNSDTDLFKEKRVFFAFGNELQWARQKQIYTFVLNFGILTCRVKQGGHSHGIGCVRISSHFQQDFQLLDLNAQERHVQNCNTQVFFIPEVSGDK